MRVSASYEDERAYREELLPMISRGKDLMELYNLKKVLLVTDGFCPTFVYKDRLYEADSTVLQKDLEYLSILTGIDVKYNGWSLNGF